jgi:hypothetical protein
MNAIKICGCPNCRARELCASAERKIAAHEALAAEFTRIMHRSFTPADVGNIHIRSGLPPMKVAA